MSRCPACTSSGLASDWNTRRWIATGASITATVANASASRQTYQALWKESSSSKRDWKGSVTRKPASTWTPVWLTRSSCSSSFQLRSARSCRVSSRASSAILATLLSARPTPTP